MIPFEPEIKLRTDQISRKKFVKYLGLHIDDNLKFSQHVDTLKTKLSRLAGVSYRLKSYFNYKTSKNYYYACVYSMLTYCLAAYGGALESYRGRTLVRLHERIVRNLFSKYDRINCPFKTNKLLKLPDIYRSQACIHMYKAINLDTNESVAETLALQTANHQYETKTRNLLRPPFPRVDAIRLNYHYQFQNIWNEIPDTIKESRTLKSFKRNLNECFLSMY